MKRIFSIFLLAAVLLCGCAPEESSFTVGANYRGRDITLTVDTENHTIFDGQYTYTYQVSGNTATVTYPNGARYYETTSGSVSNMSWDNSYDPETYIDGEFLIQAIGDSSGQKRGGNVLASLFLIALGAFYIFVPHAAWYISYGWHYKDAEPSDASLTVARISGVAVAIVGLILLIA